VRVTITGALFKSRRAASQTSACVDDPISSKSLLFQDAKKRNNSHEGYRRATENSHDVGSIQ